MQPYLKEKIMKFWDLKGNLKVQSNQKYDYAEDRLTITNSMLNLKHLFWASKLALSVINVHKDWARNDAMCYNKFLELQIFTESNISPNCLVISKRTSEIYYTIAKKVENFCELWCDINMLNLTLVVIRRCVNQA